MIPPNYHRAQNFDAWAIGHLNSRTGRFHVRRVVWGRLMARMDKMEGEVYRRAVILTATEPSTDPPSDDPVGIIARLLLPWSQRAVLLTLAAQFGQWVYGPTLLQAVYAHRSDGGPATAKKCIDVTVWHARRALRDTPLMIETNRGGGTKWGRRLTWRTAPESSA